MAKEAAILGVHLFTPQGPIRIGTLSRDRDGATNFAIDEVYLRDPERPILSLSWYAPGSKEKTKDRLADRNDKIGLHGTVPPWFAGLLPEGALRALVNEEMGPGDHDQFDLIARLGADLPGGVLIVPETQLPSSAGPLRLEQIEGFEAPRPHGIVKFSLAGVQLKLTAILDGDRLTMPASAVESRFILKLPAEHYPALPEYEYAAMQLCQLIGVNTASCSLIPTAKIDAVPGSLLEHGDTALIVERFDRMADQRIHIEDAAQVLGAIGERKYTMGTAETVLNMIRRFSTEPRLDLIEGFRRFVADILIGNGDNHLKNWSFIFPERGQIRLSPAYDIVPTVFYKPADTLALRFVGTHDFAAVNFHKIRRIADYVDLNPDMVEKDIRKMINRALELWPKQATTYLSEEQAHKLIARLKGLALVQETIA